MVLIRLLHEFVRVLRAFPRLAQSLAVRLRELEGGHARCENLLGFPLATVAVVLRCSMLADSCRVFIRVGDFLVELSRVS
jgi:hypothetical protein